jgi:hypothetical protein
MLQLGVVLSWSWGVANGQIRPKTLADFGAARSLLAIVEFVSAWSRTDIDLILGFEA